MNGPQNGFEYLNQLRKTTGKQELTFQELEHFLGQRAREKGVPVSGKFELTPLCNFSCKMCYVHLGSEQLNGRTVLSVDTWKDLMHQAWEAGMISATLTGGECLTYPGFEELYLYLHSLGCEVAVLTNGFLLDKERILFFQKHRPADIQITLYGSNDDIYERVTGQRAFTTVVNNIKQAVEANLPVCISITPNKYLGEDLLDTIRVAKALCNTVIINSFYKTPREETGRSEQQGDADIDLYIRAFKYINELDGRNTVGTKMEELPPYGGTIHQTSDCGLQCGGGRSGFAIDWKGTMTPCTDLNMICAYPLKDGFTASWRKINQEVNHWPCVPECIGCAYSKVCNNCAANMLRYAEPGKQPHELCENTKLFVCHGIKHIPECEK